MMKTTQTRVMKQCAAWLALLACAALLAACGGGGGSPGANSNGVQPVVSKVAGVALKASAPTIDASGNAGTEVTLTATVTDVNNNALVDQVVDFQSDSGVITNTIRKTDVNGQVVEKLSIKNDPTPRVITITASSGTVSSTAVKVTVVLAMPTLTLTADSGVLPSSGAAGSEVNLTTVVKDSANNVMAGVTVGLSADSGNLSYANHVTDAKGAVTAKLDTSSDPTSRKITVTASASGAKSVSVAVTVSGNKLVINNSATVKVGASTDIAVKLVDSAGNAMVGRPVSYSSGANTLSVKGGGTAVTNTAGQLVLSYTAATPGVDTIVVKAMGETASSSITVSAANFSVSAVDGAGNPVGSTAINGCQAVAIHSDVGGVAQTGTVALSVSRGNVYGDPGCGTLLGTPLTLVNGNATGYVQALSPGVATLTVVSNGVTAQGALEFVAPYTAAATVTLQADPATLGVNTPGSTAQQSTLRAIVLDGTAANNLVKNAQVAFSIVKDPSGGSLTQPSVVSTGSDGTASVSYIAGTTDTKLDGVVIQAQLQGASSNVGTVNMTVAKRSLFISAGTGNTVITPNDATYQVNYSVFVTDATGNPVPGVNLTSSVRPRYYYKGRLYYNGQQGPWQVSAVPGQEPVPCLNEDVNSDGKLQPGEDVNGDGFLTPGIPLSVTPSAVTTDAKGQATVSLLYPRNLTNWLDVALTIRGQVSGSEAAFVTYTGLLGLAADYQTASVTPPGLISPYGQARSCNLAN